MNMASVDGVSDFIHANIRKTEEKNNQDLSMDDFLQLMVAQLQNQDMFSPVDNTQFLNQMAQFSMVNAMTQMTQLSTTSYSTSLIGKLANVAYVSDLGQTVTDSGIIESVNLYNGTAEVVVNGKSYALSNIMTVNDATVGGSASLLSGAALIGKTAGILHATDSGIENVSGVIEGLKLRDGELYVVVGGKTYALREVADLNETTAAEDEDGSGEGSEDGSGGASGEGEAV
jgi:flagellar basal-body rod modification protein FlgD